MKLIMAIMCLSTCLTGGALCGAYIMKTSIINNLNIEKYSNNEFVLKKDGDLSFSKNGYFYSTMSKSQIYIYQTSDKWNTVNGELFGSILIDTETEESTNLSFYPDGSFDTIVLYDCSGKKYEYKLSKDLSQVFKIKGEIK